MKAFIGVTFTAAAVCVATGCGSDKNNDSQTTEIDGNSAKTDLVDYSMLNYTDKQIDSIAVYGVDFVTPGEGAGLLYYYYGKINSGASGKEPLKRKFKDIYDILKGIHGSAFVTALEKVKAKKGVDLMGAYEEYAGLLDTADDGGTFAQEEVVDTATATGATDVLPEGVTDAEVSESNGIIIVSPTATEEE